MMKKTIMLSLAIISILDLTKAQFQKGTTEISVAGNIGSYSLKSSSNSIYYSGSSSETKNYLLLDLSTGFFVADGFSIEPEIGWFALEGIEPSIHLLGNLSYTMPNPTSKISPFVKVGYGLANSMEFPGMGVIGRISDKMDVAVFNVGAGVKYLVASDIALKLEANYRKHSWSSSSNSYGYSISNDMTYSTTGLLFGFSVLL
jgi:hypothetical protein